MSGAYNTSYDIWDTDPGYEIMLWVNHNGAVGPLGSYQGNARVGGHMLLARRPDPTAGPGTAAAVILSHSGRR